ncbi:unnamed protein product [Trypanosoma congolense IL3000]|uniref:WGS project CAEQ00000000 data, annotated contig 695 n=1 Tax=Trypanosoma congolense (strain IL3000) TaxID=1068625 RepID=F9WHU6_TRYCI|nr:unnamed protein product [Trypanosoma congolense IL3000]
MMSLLFVLLRIMCFVLLFAVLLRVKKTRVRYLPSRRTRVSRHHGETCAWLERLVSAVLDMFYCAAREGNESTEQASLPSDDFASRSASKEMGGRGASDTRVRSDSWRLLEMFEGRVVAFLEDRGIAAQALFQIHSIGDKPPIIRTIRVINRTGLESAPLTSATLAAAGPSAGVGVPVTGDKNMGTAAAPTNASLPGVSAPPVAASGGGGVARPFLSSRAKLRSLQQVFHSGSEGVEKWRNDLYAEEGAAASAKGSASAPPSVPAAAIELEAEVEYAGGIDVRLAADICLARGRRLPVFVRVSDVEYIRAHVRLHATLKHEDATMDSQRKPYLQCTLWLESEPAFSFQMSTSLSRYKIHDFFALPMIAKFLFLRFVGYRMVYPHGAGVSFNIPLPEHVVDGGAYKWFSSMDDMETVATTSMMEGFRGCGASL